MPRRPRMLSSDGDEPVSPARAQGTGRNPRPSGSTGTGRNLRPEDDPFVDYPINPLLEGTGTGRNPRPEDDEPERNPREAALANKTSRQVRTKRPRAVDEDEEEEMNEDDEKERRFQREFVWELFLYHRRIPDHDANLIKGIYGQDCRPESREWQNCHQKMQDMQKNKKSAVLNGMKKLMRKHASMPENAALLDQEIRCSDRAIEQIAWRAWSEDNYYQVWTWMMGVVDYEKSSPLGKYYIEWVFKGLAVEVSKYLRVELENEREAKTRWEDVWSFYFDLPTKAEFKDVEKRHFHELPWAVLNKKKLKASDEKRREENHSRFTIAAPPPPAD